jgi:hypothetical protein
MTAPIIALVLFGLAALGGATLLARRLKGGNPALGLAMAHGTAAAGGLVTLIVAVVGGAGGLHVVALVIFGVAALGGFYLLSFHLRGRLLPLGVVLVHATVAVAGS